MKIIAFGGKSGSGKTTAIETLIRHYVAHGRSVSAIKHTHHELNTDDRGDTSRFRRAGAKPVILAGLQRAVIFGGEQPHVVEYDTATDLVARCNTEIVFVEGFASIDRWPRIELVGGEWRTPRELIDRVESIGQ